MHKHPTWNWYSSCWLPVSCSFEGAKYCFLKKKSNFSRKRLVFFCNVERRSVSNNNDSLMFILLRVKEAKKEKLGSWDPLELMKQQHLQVCHEVCLCRHGEVRAMNNVWGDLTSCTDCLSLQQALGLWRCACTCCSQWQ